MACTDRLNHHIKTRVTTAWTEGWTEVVMKPPDADKSERWDVKAPQKGRSDSWPNQLKFYQFWWLKILWGRKQRLLLCIAQVRPSLGHRNIKCNIESFYTGHIQLTWSHPHGSQMTHLCYHNEDQQWGFLLLRLWHYYLTVHSENCNKTFPAKKNNPDKPPSPNHFLCL